MKDSDLRGIVLQKFYDLRKNGGIWRLTPDDLGGMDVEEYERIGDQLSEHGYIEWSKSLSVGYASGRINARGVDVIEGNVHPLIAITMHHDQSINVTGSTNIAVRNNNTIRTSADITKIEHAIEKLPISDQEKADTKSLLSRISGNASFASLVGAIATVMAGQAQ